MDNYEIKKILDEINQRLDVLRKEYAVLKTIASFAEMNEAYVNLELVFMEMDYLYKKQTEFTDLLEKNGRK